MSILARLFGRRDRTDGGGHAWREIPRSGYLELHGLEHHPGPWVRLYGRPEKPVNKDVSAVLVREPSNRHDPHAVQVLVAGELAGYLPREVAGPWSTWLAPLEADGIGIRCTAHVWYRWSRGFPHPGLYVNLLIPDDPIADEARQRERHEAAEARQQRAADRAAEIARRAAERDEKAAEKVRHEQEWRAAGLCANCGAALPPTGRGRPRIFCDTCHPPRQGAS